MNEDIILQRFGFTKESYKIEPFGTGLINHTWLVIKNEQGEKYILQRINDQVFKQPEDIAFNIRMIGSYLKGVHPDYFFVTPLLSTDGEDLVINQLGHYRVLPFVSNSHTVDAAENVGQSYEASRQFGRFTRKSIGIRAEQLKITLPDFHNLTLRFQQFERAIKRAISPRKEIIGDCIQFLLGHKDIVGDYEKIRSCNMERRVIHHDTKISNVLFDEKDCGICVIDLDTVMPGYFISDVGDMMRTYLSSSTEEEGDFMKIDIRDEFFDAIADGYLSEMQDVLTEMEIKCFVYSGKFIIYMQALRFATDYLNNDIYYGQNYEGQNLVRALNQIQLLKLYLEREPLFESKVKRYCKRKTIVY